MITDPIFQTYDYAIGGKLVAGRAEMSEDYRMMVEDGDQEAVFRIKQKLVRDMAEYMLENKLVEFTYQDDPYTLRRHVLVRAYVAPNDQVKILRMANKIV